MGTKPSYSTIQTSPNAFIRQHHDATSSWQKVRIKNLEREIGQYAGEAEFGQIAEALLEGMPRSTHLTPP